VSDTTRVREAFGWKPKKSMKDIVTEIHEWIRSDETVLRPLFG
jgi:nucleoside-diphosphate-sugar epimerase